VMVRQVNTLFENCGDRCYMRDPLHVRRSSTIYERSESIDGRWDASLITMEHKFHQTRSPFGSDAEGDILRWVKPYDGTTSATYRMQALREHRSTILRRSQPV